MQKVIRINRGVCVLVVVALTVIGAPLAIADWSPPIAITKLTIVTGRGTTIESGTIIISKGRVTDVGADVEIPTEAKRIDGSGLGA